MDFKRQNFAGMISSARVQPKIPGTMMRVNEKLVINSEDFDE